MRLPVSLTARRGEVISVVLTFIKERSVNPRYNLFIDGPPPDRLKNDVRLIFADPFDEVFNQFQILAGQREDCCKLLRRSRKNGVLAVYRSIDNLNVLHPHPHKFALNNASIRPHAFSACARS